MRRKGLTRTVALVTAMSVLMSGFAVGATGTTTTGTTATGTTTTGTTATATGTTNSADASTKEIYVDERLENNYTKVSAKYTSPKYTGEDITIPVMSAYSTLSGGKLTTDVQGYTESNQVVELDELKQTAKFTFNVENSGIYYLKFDYLPYNEDTSLNIEGSLKVNGEVPFYEANRVVFENQWIQKDGKSYTTDRYDNQIVVSPVKSGDWISKYLMDASYRHDSPLGIELEAGTNYIEFTLTESQAKLGNLYLTKEVSAESYKAGNPATGEGLIVIDSQEIDQRNDSSIRPINEYNMDLYPYETNRKVLNIIDSASFSSAGQSVSWNFKVEKSGYYKIANNYRQSDKKNFPVFLDILIDGEIPNSAFQSYPMTYDTNFKTETLKKDNEELTLYLEAGTHMLTYTISDSNVCSALETVDRVMSEVNDLELEITKVAGTNKDKYRDMKITDYIPNIEARLNTWINDLQAQYDQMSSYSESKNAGTLASMKMAIIQLKDLVKKPNELPFRKTELSSSASSVNTYLANFVTDITNDAISFDRTYIYQDDAELPKPAGFFARLWETIKRFFSSFTQQAYSVDNVDTKHLQVWMNRSRQYIEVLQQMIDKEFTPQTGIEVDVSIMPDPNKLVLANAAGEAPDVAMAVNYALPYELAIRNALVDMTRFDDYKEVLGRFPEGLLVPSTIGDGIYSMPETFYFWVLYYRSDVLKKLGLEVPETIEDVKAMIPDLQNRGLNFYYPTAGTVGQRTLAMTTPIIYQQGGSLYNTEGMTTAINNEKAVEAITQLTELFTIYDIPKEMNFYQHFRNGDVPIGVSDYFTYSMLINAAPEIENSWEIALVPGIEDSNGEIQRQTAGGAESEIIFKQEEGATVTLEDGTEMNREDASWEFLKWWSSTESQLEFGNTIQSAYGKEFIWNSANKEALGMLPWDSSAKEIILQQMDWIEESPRIPGTYMVERELSNAYIAVVHNGDNLRTSIDAAVKNINRETERKMEEFGYIDNEGNVIKQYTIPNIDTVKKILGTN